MIGKYCLLIAVIIQLLNQAHAQNSVGIGTENSNNNAVLELVSPNNNQGFLVPRLTSVQRLDMASNLATSENGLLVYDSEENKFYYWQNGSWSAIESGSAFTSGDGISINGNTITNEGDADADPLNEIQDIVLTGNILSITNNPDASSIDLSSLMGINTDSQDLTFTGNRIELTGDPDGTIIDLSGFDQDASDDFDGDFTSLTSVPVGLDDGDDVNDADADPTNEFNIGLALSSTSIQVTDAGGTLSTDLNTVFATNTQITASDAADLDKDNTNEYNTGSGLNVTAIEITDGGSTQSIELGGTFATDAELAASDAADLDKDNTNEYNTGSGLNITAIEITDGGSTQSIELGGTFATDAELAASDAADLDKDNTNEYNTSSALNVTAIEITDGGSTQSIELGGTFATDAELATSDAADLDKDNTNEYNTSSALNVTAIEITDGGSTQSIELGGTFATDAELAASDAADLDKDNTNEYNTGSGLNVTAIEITDGGGTQTIELDGTFATDAQVTAAVAASNAADLDKDNTNEFNTGSTLNVTAIEITDGGSTQSIELGGTFATDAELAASDAADLDKDNTNEFQTISLTGTDATLSNSGGTISVLDYNPSFFKAAPVATQSIPSGTNQILFGDITAPNYSSGQYDDTNSRYIASENGFYNFSGLITFNGSIGANLTVLLVVDGNFSNPVYQKSVPSGNISIDFTCDLSLTSGNSVAVWLINPLAGSISTADTPTSTVMYFSGRRFN